jgi:hypothetical protein
MENPTGYFTTLPDPRINRCKEHLLEDIIFITLSAVICGVKTWNKRSFGRKRLDAGWVMVYNKLSNLRRSEVIFHIKSVHPFQ